MVDSVSLNPNRLPEVPERKTTENMDSGDFMTLMLAQIKNQDPSNPEDPSQFVAELAQFSSLDNLEAIKDSVALQAETTTSNNILQATSLMDKQVTASVNSFQLGNEAPQASFTINNSAPNVKVEVLNSVGLPVNTIDIGQVSAGTHHFQWDKSTLSGNDAVSGEFTYRVVAEYDTFDEEIPVDSNSKVIGVNVDPTTSDIIAKLENGFSVNINDINNITQG